MSDTQNTNKSSNVPYIISTEKESDIGTLFNEFTKKYDSKYMIYLPSATREKVEELENMLNNMDKDEFAEYTKGKDVDLIISEINTKDYINKNSVYGKTFTNNKDNVTNSIKYGDNELNMNIAKLKEGDTSNENTELLMCKAFGLGEMINVPLWNSGFWIRLKPVTPTELVTLELEIAKNNINLGRDTLGLIYSNENVIYADILTNFIKEHITNTNLSLPAGEDIRAYISIHDYYPLLLALLTTMYPTGMPFYIECSNFIDKDVECNYAANIKVDTTKLLWVDRSKISTEMFNIMCNKKRNSVTVDNAKEYQRLLAEQLGYEKEFTIKLENGTNMVVGLTLPSILDYVNKGLEWVNGIVSKYNSLVNESNSNSDKTGIINGLILSQLMCIYSPYVSYVKPENSNIELKDYGAVINFLKRMEIENNVYKNFINGISKYIDTSSISVVATPDYTCPRCKKGHDSEKSIYNNEIKDFIPLNILHYFFVLRALKIMKRIKSLD